MTKSIRDKINILFQEQDLSNAPDQRFSEDIRKVKWIKGRLYADMGEVRDDTYVAGSMTFKGQLYMPQKMIEEYYATTPEEFIQKWFQGDAGLLNTPEPFENAVYKFPIKNEEIIVNDIKVSPLGNDMYDVEFTLSIGQFENND